MFEITKVHLTIALETLFLVLVIFSVGLGVLRRSYHKALTELQTQRDLILTLKNKLADKSPDTQPKSVVMSSPIDKNVIKQQLTERNKENAMLKQRLNNLEKFKKLCFELEKKLASSNEHSSLKKANSILKGTIKTQNELINNLKSNIQTISEKYKLESTLTANLNAIIEELERTGDELTVQLDLVTKEDRKIYLLSQELQEYRERIEQLEAAELQLKKEIEYARTEKNNNKSNPNQYGTVKIKEIEVMGQQLHDKELELKRLRDECETVGQQYEELAMASLKMTSEGSNLTTEQKNDLERFKILFEESTAALSRKKLECKMLENYYLELEQATSSVIAKQNMETAFDEKEQLDVRVRDMEDEIGLLSNEQYQQELKEIKKELEEKEEDLAKTRKNYQDLKEQYLDVAHEEIEHKRKFELLKIEHNKLKKNLLEMENIQEKLEEREAEFSTLNDEYSKLQERYLKIIEKYQ